jgi:F-type H+-transporting ATPase subunit epsilon
MTAPAMPPSGAPTERTRMTVRVLLPHRELAMHDDVIRLVADTTAGSHGLLPRRLDVIMVLRPGILTIDTESTGVQYVAVDAGTLVKVGAEVLVSVRRAREGSDLAALRDAVRAEYLAESTEEHDLRAVMSKLETGLLKRFADLRHD